MRSRAPFGLLTALTVVVSGLAFAAPAQASDITTAELPGLLTVAAETTEPAYQRDLFEHWIDSDGDGCNTRYEVLIEESTTPVGVGSGCTLEGGTWVSAMDGFVAYTPADIQIDHHVALAEAWRSGASTWTNDQRRAYANDLEVPYALNASSGTANQSKADKDPAEWLPSNEGYVCEYATAWALVKYRWSLAVDADERAALESLLSGDCGTTTIALPEVMVMPAVPEEPGEPGEGDSEEPEDPEVPASLTEVLPLPAGQTRLAGGDRYATAIEVSKRYSPEVPAVFVATGTNFPDALSAAAAAALLGGPLLLTPTAGLTPAVETELRRLSPESIYVAGGPGAVSARAFSQLAAIAPTARLSGSNRYDTGLSIVNTVFTSASTAFIATGRTFPDALAATGAAGAAGAPVILVDGLASRVDTGVLTALERLGVSRVVIAGGTGAVSTGIQSQLSSRFSVERYGGASRYDTAALINDAHFGPGSADTMFLATGANFPDALAGAALAGYLAAPLYVTAADCVAESIRTSVASLGATKTAVMGGTSVVSAAAAANLGCLSTSVPRITGSALVTATLSVTPGAWTTGTTFAYQWYAGGKAISGATGSTLTLGAAQVGAVITVRVTGSKPGYVSAAQTSKATAKVGYPSRTAPIDTWNCPSWAPIKGNADSMIYHMPNGRYYDATNPEDCFRTEAAAQAAGYRKSKL